MASETWKLWRHKQDHSVLYEVRDAPADLGLYEVRRPEASPSDTVLWWHMPKGALEEVYEPVPEEETSG